MGRGGDTNDNTCMETYSWDEVKKHVGPQDRWIVIQGLVYDISRFQKRHPGGARILGHFAGQDATDVWVAMHNDKNYVQKYMKPLLIGKVEEHITKKDGINEDFRRLRQSAEERGLFRSNPCFYAAHLGHIVLLECLAYYVLVSLGVGWCSLLLTAFILCTSQAQAGWCQHDYGHLSVFPSSRLNHLFHQITIGHLKGASSHWWTFRHHQHHAKPNVYKKDPDITLPYVFLMGEKIPVEWGKKRRGHMPYDYQQHYFWLLGPLTLLPVYFHIEVLYFVFKRRDWWDLVWILSFFTRFFYCYSPILGGLGAFGLYMAFRTMESVWFTLVTQMNHIPMEIDRDQAYDWLTGQTVSTCNVEPGWFNNWFTGHLNFQIEHHLFPTMPRHNYARIAPEVEALCERHKLKYVQKPLLTAFADIVRSLRKSGLLWYEAYHHG